MTYHYVKNECVYSGRICIVGQRWIEEEGILSLKVWIEEKIERVGGHTLKTT